MPPHKTAAKKAAKKAAKHGPKQDGPQELRRAWEHSGRIELLQASLPGEAVPAIAALSDLARHELGSGHAKDAADLLRAAEHLSFAAMAADLTSQAAVTPELKATIAEKFVELAKKAAEHAQPADDEPLLAAISRDARENAHRAFGRGAWHQALEFARAAEALAHVKLHTPGSRPPQRIGAPGSPRLKAG